MKKSRKKKDAKKVSITIAILLIIISIPTFGRYVLNKINDFYLRSNEFFFYSDKLKDTEAIYQIDNWSGVDPYTITINMKNLEKVISYKEKQVEDYITKTNAELYAEGKFLLQKNKDYI